MHRLARALRLGGVLRGHAGLDEPPEDVPDAALPGLVAPAAGDDATVDDAAHARHLGQAVGAHHVARRGAHDGHHLAGLDGLRRRGGDVRVHVADRHRDSRRQAGPGSGLGRQGPGPVAELTDGVLHLVGDEAPEARRELLEEVHARVLPVLQDPLVAGGAGVADVVAAQLPHDPVGGLHPPLHPVVELDILLEDLQSLGELPLRGDQPAVAREPRLAAGLGQAR